MKSEFYQGKIKQYDAKKGFGFIGGLEQDIFFHISDFPLEGGEPKRNERVKFMVVENNGKYKAVKLKESSINLPKLKNKSCGSKQVNYQCLVGWF
jgi:cold shock CspA family protein